MPIHVESTQYLDRVIFTITGTYDLQEAIEHFSGIIAINRRTSISKMIVDFRGLKGIPAATEKNFYALSIEEQYIEYLATGGKAFQVAYIGSTPSVSTYEPGLEMTKAQHLPFDIFTDENEAYRWLNLEPHNQAD